MIGDGMTRSVFYVINLILQNEDIYYIIPFVLVLNGPNK